MRQEPAWVRQAPVHSERLGIYIWYPKAGESASIRLLGRLTGVYEHFDRSLSRHGQYVDCTAPNCKRCETMTARLALYGPAQRYNQKTNHWHLIVGQLPAWCTDLLAADPRGMVLEVSRKAEGRDAPVKVEYLEHVDESCLPPPFDVEPYLRRAWKRVELNNLLQKEVVQFPAEKDAEAWRSTIPFAKAKELKAAEESSPATAEEFRRLRKAAGLERRRKKA